MNKQLCKVWVVIRWADHGMGHSIHKIMAGDTKNDEKKADLWFDENTYIDEDTDSPRYKHEGNYMPWINMTLHEVTQ